MTTRKKITSGIFILVLTTLCSYGYTLNQEEQTSPQTLGALGKSLLIPGWGQLSENHILEGVLFLSAEIVCAYNFFRNNHKGNQTHLSYKNAITVEETVHFRGLTERYDTRRNQFLLAAGVVWILNLIDIYMIVSKNKTKERNLKLGLESATEKKLVFTISYRF